MISEYHVFVAIVDEGTLAADYWLDQLDGGTRWEGPDNDEDDEDNEDEGGSDRITRLVAWLAAG